MNDLTKDELIELKIVLKEYLAVFTSPESTHQLEDKIKSMIDNYCYHDGEIGKDFPAEKCMKCGKYWE